MDIVIKQIDQHTHMILWKLPCKLDKQKRKEKKHPSANLQNSYPCAFGGGGGGVVYVRSAYTISILMYISLSKEWGSQFLQIVVSICKLRGKMFREKVGLMQGPPPSPCYVPITSTLTNFSAFASEKPFGYYRAIIGCTILRLHLVIQYNVYVHVGQSLCWDKNIC